LKRQGGFRNNGYTFTSEVRFSRGFTASCTDVESTLMAYMTARIKSNTCQ